MPNFIYQVKNENGKVIGGQISADNIEALKNMFKAKGYEPIDIVEKTFLNDITQLSFLKPPVKVKDISLFCRQCAIILEAGIPLGNALDVLRDQTINPTLKEVVNDLYDNVQKGITLSHAMKSHRKIFPDLLQSMVEAGEISGQLDTVFVRMADHFEKDYKLRKKIKSSLSYPVILIVACCVSVLVLMIFVLPQFKKILSDLKVELPLVTKIVMGAGDFVGAFWWLIILIVFGTSVGLKAFSRKEEGKRLFAKFSLEMPLLKVVTRNIMTARLTRTLSTLLSSGVLLIQALEITQKVMGNYIIQQMIGKVIEDIKKGSNLTKPLTEMKYFPSMLISMIKIGEETGELDYTLEKTAEYYEQEVDSSLQALSTFIEPLVIGVMAIIVATIVISILLPMFSIYQNIGKS